MCQIAALIHRHPSLPWNQVLQQAEQMIAKEALLTGVWLAHQFLSSPPPVAVTQCLETMPAIRAITMPWLGAENHES